MLHRAGLIRARVHGTLHHGTVTAGANTTTVRNVARLRGRELTRTKDAACRLLQGKQRQIFQRCLRLFTALLQLRQIGGILKHHRAHTGTAKSRQVATGAQNLAQITCQGTNIGARRARNRHLAVDHGNRGCRVFALVLGVLNHVLGKTRVDGMYRELANRHRTRRQLNLLTATHTRIRTNTVDLNSGHRRRNLQNIATELRHRLQDARTHLLSVQTGQRLDGIRMRGGVFTLGVLGQRLKP